MKFGIMNSPKKDLEKEIKYAFRNKFDFIDLTLEGKAVYNKININEVKKLLNKYKKKDFFAIGHTSWYLTPGDELDEFREATIKVMKKNLRIFSDLNINLVNIHLIAFSFLSKKETAENFIETFKKLITMAKKYDIKIMIENCEPSVDINMVGNVLKKVPDLKLHLDVGHANLNYKKNKTEDYFRRFKNKIAHIHVSDNHGGKDDEHLGIGKGNINWKKIVKILKKYNYDKTITLETFKGSKNQCVRSKNKLKKLLGEE